MVASTILSRKIIKPFSPTPPSRRRHNLSFMDYVSPPEYAPIAAFYSKPTSYNISQTSNILENALSKVLDSYYPFAGTIVDNKYVDCNDIGVEYLTVRINCPMSEILNHPYNNATDVVFPQDLTWSRSVNGYLLVVQLSHFDCGGIAISVCIWHKIADGYSLCKFLDDWAATSRDADFKPSLRFDASSFFPLIDDLPVLPNVTLEPHRCVSRMYHFSSSSLTILKDIIATGSGVVHNPTRVEVATTLVHKCVVETSLANSKGVFKPSLLCHVMNLRPPLPLNTIGNACCHFSSVATTEDDIKLHNFGAQLHIAKQQLRDELKVMSTDELTAHALEKVKRGVEKLEKNTFDIYSCSSLCNFGLHKTDFGWGRPIRVTLASNRVKNNFYFFDDPNGDGINALITLREDDMLMLQSNKEFLEFVSPINLM
ncbi:hypothetical protein HAX54_046152 [Datura stramonium]|uniref:Acylsugar acyltransferase 3-like n=1 Tax=Datura stramonium TaxID=4076 RepID=A0ABS8WIL7_DATST|nr:hypothetical protein [Datura stramonium]